MRFNIVEHEDEYKSTKRHPLMSLGFYEQIASLLIFNGLILLALVIMNPQTVTLGNLGFLSIFSVFIPLLTIYFFTPRQQSFFDDIAKHPFLLSGACFIQAGILWYTHPEVATSLFTHHIFANSALIMLWILFPFIPERYRRQTAIDSIYALPANLMYFCLFAFAILHAINTVLFVAKHSGLPTPF